MSPELAQIVAQYRSAFDEVARHFLNDEALLAQGRAVLAELEETARAAGDVASFVSLAEERDLYGRIGRAMATMARRALDRPAAGDEARPRERPGARGASTSTTSPTPTPTPTVGLEVVSGGAPVAVTALLRPYRERLAGLAPGAAYVRRALRRILDAGGRVDTVAALLRALAERGLDLELSRAEIKDDAHAALADARARGDGPGVRYRAGVLRAVAEAGSADELALHARLERLRIEHDRETACLAYRLERITRLFSVLAAYREIPDQARRERARRIYRRLVERHDLTWAAIAADPDLRAAIDRRRDDWPPARLEELRRALFEEILG